MIAKSGSVKSGSWDIKAEILKPTHPFFIIFETILQGDIQFSGVLSRLDAFKLSNYFRVQGSDFLKRQGPERIDPDVAEVQDP